MFFCLVHPADSAGFGWLVVDFAGCSEKIGRVQSATRSTASVHTLHMVCYTMLTS